LPKQVNEMKCLQKSDKNGLFPHKNKKGSLAAILSNGNSHDSSTFFLRIGLLDSLKESFQTNDSFANARNSRDINFSRLPEETRV